MRLKMALEGDLVAHMRAEANAVRRAMPATMERATLGLQQDVRREILRAGLGQRVANATRRRVYRNKEGDAAGLVWSNAPDIVSAFRRGATIRSKSGFWLAIPTAAAPKRGRDGKRINPSNFPEERLGKLRFVHRRGKPGLLVVDNVRVSASGRVRANVTRRRDGSSFSRLAGRQTVVMFVLVPQVTLRKRLSIGRLADRWRRRLPQLLAEEIDREVAAQGRTDFVR